MSTAALLAAVLFGAVWSITEKECLPGGNLFGVTSIFICALIGGKLVALIHLPGLPPLPPLLGKAVDLHSSTTVFCLQHISLHVFFITQKHKCVNQFVTIVPTDRQINW